MFFSQALPGWKNTSLVVYLFFAIGLLGVSACGSENSDDTVGGIGGRDVPTLALNHAAMNFVDVAIGGEDRQTLVISNAGMGVLRITSVQLLAGDEFHQGDNWFSSAELKAGESKELTVFYRPVDTDIASGYIEIQSNDPDNRSVQVQLRTSSLGPQIFSPETIQFSRVPAGSSDWQLSDIHNIGQADLEIREIVLTGSSAFSVTYPVSGGSSPVESDTDDWPKLIKPDESAPMRIHFSPQSDEPSTAEVIVYSNDSRNESYRVYLSGNSGSACMRVENEEGVNFREATIGRTAFRTVTIQNCSYSSDLELNSIAITESAGGVYELRADSLPSGLPEAKAVLSPRQTVNFVVSFTPSEESMSQGVLTIESDDPSKRAFELELRGRGTTNECPIAIAQGRVEDTDELLTQITAHPLNTVELNGLASTDPDGSISGYEWAVITRPQNSLSRLTPSNVIAEPNLWLDLAGVYEVELTVYDNEGMPSCEPSVLRIHSVPGEEIHIQLVWDSPSVQSPGDGVGTDLDLHYLHPVGWWDQPPWDIYWLNPRQNWGTDGEPSIASLDIDDRWGIAPENVNHSKPEEGLSYSIGVYYYADNGYGAAYATVRIYILGELREEIRDRQLQRAGMFWYVGDIYWPSGDINLQDRFQLGFP